MKKILFLPLLIISIISLGQPLPALQLPQVLPASPEASAIAKGGQLDVGLFTGAPSASIPFYDISLRNLKIPIGLNYSSNGVKVDEIPSRTGIGWTFSAAGSVNRIVHGKPDDKAVRTPPLSGNPSATVLANYYNELAANTSLDNEPDEFIITAPGLSARFVLDSNDVPVFIPHANLKVEISGGFNNSDPFDQFVVTTTEGIKYYFGGTGAIETTITHNQIAKWIVHQQVRTAFYLKKIVLPEGDAITYNYTQIRFTTFPGITQAVRKGHPLNVYQICGQNSLVCPSPTIDPGSFQENVAEVMYQSVYLDRIQGPNGLYISFSYENRPDDSGDKRLTGVTVRGPQFAKSWLLTYDDPSTTGGGSGGSNPSAGSFNKRFFLDQVKEIKPAQGYMPADTVKYILEYEDKTLPARLSFSQDILGYNNGAYNAYFLPQIPGQDWGQYGTADRSFRFSYAVKGMLKKITYPTLGYDEFVYEPNTIAQLEGTSGSGNLTVTKSISGSGNSNPSNPSGTWIWVTHISDTFRIQQNQNVSLFIQTFKNPGCESCTQAPDTTVNWAWVKIVNVISSDTVWDDLIRMNMSNTFSIPLNADSTYKIVLKIKGLPNAGYAQVTYNQAPSGYQGGYNWINVEAGGVRVKEIKSYDPVSEKTNHKYYKYASKATPTRSSGATTFIPDYLEETDYIRPCRPEDGYENTEWLTCKYLVLSSNSAMPVYLFDNNHIGYEYVVESDDPNFANGCIEHIFSITPFNNRNLITGYEIKSVPSNTVVFSNGNELKTKYYNAPSTVVKEIKNVYSQHYGFENRVSCMSVRRRYPDNGYANNTQNYLHPFDVTSYDYISYWTQLDSTIVSEYDGLTTLKTITANHYGNSSNILPSATHLMNSKGELTSTEYYYPTDFSSSAPYSDMVSKNVISPFVEQVGKNGSTELWRAKNYYHAAISGNLFRIDSIKRSIYGGSLMMEAIFDLYDTKGNVQQLRTRGNDTTSYIWGYNQVYPVAKIAGRGYNASISESGINLNYLGGIPDDGTGQSELGKLTNVSGALVSSYLYRPYVGVWMETDIRGRKTFYSYDNIGRLTLIRDHDGKVIKKICYNYAGHAEYCSTECTDLEPDWENTATAQRCQVDSIGQFTGYKEYEQRDMNNCSPTYYQTRWLQGSYDTSTCKLASNVTLTSTNINQMAGFLAVYVNENTGQFYSFAISAASGSQSLGTIPSGVYSIYMYKPGNFFEMTYGSGCSGETQSAVIGEFHGKSISSANCHAITLEAGN